jgi:predicted component of type VI protein secretion system
MDETDFYHRWLGIPPQEQPVSYYRLLGIPLFEDDLEVIANSADRQRSFVKRQSGNVKKFEALGQKILNEIEVARICLMNAEKRQAYDEQLRLRLSEIDTPIQATQESNSTPPPFFIGSDKNCDLVIDSKSVSSIHCSIVNHASRIILRDLKSTNGTSVNLKKIIASNFQTHSLQTPSNPRASPSLDAATSPKSSSTKPPSRLFMLGAFLTPTTSQSKT